MTNEPTNDQPSAQDKSGGVGTGLFLLLVAAYLLFGAFETFRTSAWPWFMPPILDLVALFLSLFGKPVGVYLAGAFVGTLGAVFAWAGVEMVAKGHA